MLEEIRALLVTQTIRHATDGSREAKSRQLTGSFRSDPGELQEPLPDCGGRGPEEGGMQVAFYDWTTYWTGALEKGQGSLPRCVLDLLEAARDDDYEDFEAQARSIPYLELTVAQIIFERIEELHREEPGLDRPAEAIAELVDVLISEEARRNAA